MASTEEGKLIGVLTDTVTGSIVDSIVGTIIFNVVDTATSSIVGTIKATDGVGSGTVSGTVDQASKTVLGVYTYVNQDTGTTLSANISGVYSEANKIEFAYFTDNLNVSSDGTFNVTGDGVFDDTMEAINTHIDAQFQLGRITGADYATVYLGAMQSAMTVSMQYVLGRAKEENSANLIKRQKQGFDDDARQKVLKQVLDTWSVAYSVSQSGVVIPDSIHPDTIDNITKSILSETNVIDPTVTTDVAINTVVKVEGNALGIPDPV